jgi:hypothetical protein
MTRANSLDNEVISHHKIHPAKNVVYEYEG